MRKLTLIIMILLTFTLFAEIDINFSETSSEISVTVNTEKADIQELLEKDHTEYRTFAIPAEKLTAHVKAVSYDIYSKEGELLSRHNENDIQFVNVARTFTMREMKAADTEFFISKTLDNNRVAVLKSMDVNFVYEQRITVPSTISSVFRPVYARLADNFDASYLYDIPNQKRKMLILGHSDTEFDESISYFISWKKSLGFDIIMGISGTDYDPTSTVSIKNYVQSVYDSEEIKPEFVLIIGDIVGNYAVSTTLHDNDASDLEYTLLDGTDYLPEMIIGRFSCKSVSELDVLVFKTISYEQNNIYAKGVIDGDTGHNCYTNSVVVAGNYASGSLTMPVTPVLTSKWVQEELLDYGYSRVDTLFYYHGGYAAGTMDVVNSINAGAQFISYRGWGDANGWHKPSFNKDQLDLEAANYVGPTQGMPIVSSIVCNTGDFANASNDNKCFGEIWMLQHQGLRNAFGAVGFFGPSDLHTSTELNNAICAGFYTSVLQEGSYDMGTSFLRGKAELNRGFPNERESGGKVEFYYRVYNLLSDPSLRMWKLIPNQFGNLIDDENITRGTESIVIDVTGIENAVATATTDKMTYTYDEVSNGMIILPVDTTTGSELEITVSAPGYQPYIDTLSIVSDDKVSVTESVFTNLKAGEQANLSLTVKNYGTTDLTGLTATLTSDSPYFDGTRVALNFGDIAAGATATDDCDFNVTSSCPNFESIIFAVEFSNGDMSKLEGYVSGLFIEFTEIEVDSDDDILDPGETADVDFEVHNMSSMDIQNLQATVTSSSSALTINNTTVNFGQVANDGTVTGTVNITAGSSVYNGRNVRIKFDFTDEAGREFRNYAYLVIGEVSTTSPTGPDQHGYYAYDSFDTDYSQAPTYDWIEIDPDSSSYTGVQVISLEDDDSEIVDIPIDFMFYGRTYNSITVCSNGWISFKETWMANFRNWELPSYLGPGAMVAPYWDDLGGRPINENDEEELDIFLYHDQTNNRYIIQWDTAWNFDNRTSMEKFEIILIPREENGQPVDGDIIFQYKHINNPDELGNFCTIGIENRYHTDAIQYHYAGVDAPTASPLQPGLAIRFTTINPDNVTGNNPEDVPEHVTLLNQNYPNPFNPTTQINFSIKDNANVELAVYNIAGQKIKTLEKRILKAGNHTVTWNGKDENGKDVSSGIYFYKLNTGTETQVRKMILLK